MNDQTSLTPSSLFEGVIVGGKRFSFTVKDGCAWQKRTGHSPILTWTGVTQLSLDGFIREMLDDGVELESLTFDSNDEYMRYTMLHSKAATKKQQQVDISDSLAESFRRAAKIFRNT